MTTQDKVITKWEVTAFDVLDEFMFNYGDIVKDDEYGGTSYGECIDIIFEHYHHKLYTDLLNSKAPKADGIISKLVDKTPTLSKWLIDHAEDYFTGISYPDENMYRNFFFDYLDNTKIQGEHCINCKKKIQCELQKKGE